MPRPEPAFWIGRGPIDDLADLHVVQGAKDEHPGPRQQRGVHLERWVFGSRADQGDDPLLHEGQHGILLTLVEAMDLVDEQNGSLPRLCSTQSRLLDVSPQVRHSGADRAQRDKVRRGDAGNQPGQRRFAAAGRTPEDHRPDAIFLDGATQLVLGSNQMLLTDELIQ